MTTSQDIQKMIRRLRQMRTKTPDGLGAYLGDGMPHQPRVDLRSETLALLLEELVSLREHKDSFMESIPANDSLRPTEAKLVEFQVLLDNFAAHVADEAKTEGRGGQSGDRSIDARAKVLAYVNNLIARSR